MTDQSIGDQAEQWLNDGLEQQRRDRTEEWRPNRITGKDFFKPEPKDPR